MSGDEEWIIVADAAEKSGYSVRTLQRLLQDGKIEGWKPGRDWLTTLEAAGDTRSHQRSPFGTRDIGRRQRC